MADPEDTETYDPSTPEANRAIQQGIGVGARDLAAQRDPGEGDAPLDDAVDEDEND
ncbi:hypothetical protein [Caulobacter flavus]|uniref:hypothetical protein n=1 Tax=Caulobacter flavus TaxID=1679497 RepID=UPI0013DE3A4B|nr:hypothetical protein [Caulobacter flavus]